MVRFGPTGSEKHLSKSIWVSFSILSLPGAEPDGAGAARPTILPTTTAGAQEEAAGATAEGGAETSGGGGEAPAEAAGGAGESFRVMATLRMTSTTTTLRGFRDIRTEEIPLSVFSSV